MIIAMEPDAPESAVESVIDYLVKAGCDVHRSSGQTLTILGVVGNVGVNDVRVVEELPGVAKVMAVSERFKLASRRFRPTPTIVDGEWGAIGGERPWVGIEPVGLKGAPGETDAGHGPASTPLRYEVAAGRPFDAAITRSPLVPESVGALACLSLHPRPAEPKWPVVFVARQPSWGPERWIEAAERELERAGGRVVLVEAGGEYPTGARWLDATTIARARELTHLPIIVDVPTVAQHRRFCAPIACAAVSAGASGVIVRVWVGEESSRPRVPATLRWADAVDLAERLRAVGEALRR